MQISRVDTRKKFLQDGCEDRRLRELSKLYNIILLAHQVTGKVPARQCRIYTSTKAGRHSIYLLQEYSASK
jgi:hypothetical protein